MVRRWRRGPAAADRRAGTVPAHAGAGSGPAMPRPPAGAGCRAGRARRQRAAPRAEARPGLHWHLEKRFAFAFPGHDARGIWGGACTMLARGGAHPLLPLEGAGGLKPPTGGFHACVSEQRHRLSSAFGAAPPPNLHGGCGRAPPAEPAVCRDGWSGPRGQRI